MHSRASDSESGLGTLRRFDYHVEQLRNRRLLQPGNLDTTLRLHRLPGGDFEIRMRDVDIEDLRSLVMDLRLFIAKGNRTHIDRVFNVAQRHITDERFVEALKNVRRQWKVNWEKEGVVRLLQESGPSYTAPEVLDLWINGRWFHPDDDKARRLAALDDVRMTRWMLIAAAETAATGILLAGLIVRRALREGLVSPTPVR